MSNNVGPFCFNSFLLCIFAKSVSYCIGTYTVLPICSKMQQSTKQTINVVIGDLRVNSCPIFKMKLGSIYTGLGNFTIYSKVL